MHKKGEPLERALPDAGIERIRPVMGATIHALFPLALEGGPLWKPLCYAQIGGLVVAIFITLLLVPVFYSIFVLDLKWIKWEKTEDRIETTEAASQSRRLQLSGERRYLELQHALQTSLQRRFTKGLAIDANYTRPRR
jgi:AcrB/AcrD/AcrF family